MNRTKLASGILATIGVSMISMALVFQNTTSNLQNSNLTKYEEINVKNMAASANLIIKEKQDSTAKTTTNTNATALTAVKMETAPASVIIPPRIEVYEGMTLEELTAKLNKNLGTGYISGKGSLIASYCLAKGVDPYVAVAIMLHETGCQYSCSSLARNCNNVGGQKGSPSCSGSYKGYATLDDGIRGFIDNLASNYYALGYTTVETIGPRYAESNTWVSNINNYINKIRAS